MLLPKPFPWQREVSTPWSPVERSARFLTSNEDCEKCAVSWPDGRLLFVEHGRSPERRTATWQDRLTPVWKGIAGGCHLNRPIAQLIEAAGFRMERLETGYMTGPKLMTFTYEGCARPA